MTDSFSVWATSAKGLAGPAAPRPAAAAARSGGRRAKCCEGTRPIVGTPSTVSISSSILDVRIEVLEEEGEPDAAEEPDHASDQEVQASARLDGWSGTSARSTIAMFDVSSAEEIWVSLSRVRSAV